jgi:hypothetical protein
MSLTSLIRTDPEVRARLAASIRRPSRLISKPAMLIEPRTTRNTVTGTAFDYLLRFELARRHPGLYPGEGQWIADLGVRELSRKHRKHGLAFLEQTRALYRSYITDASGLHELAQATTVLAKLDLIFRANWEDPDPLSPDEAISSELMALLRIVPFGELQARHTLLTNPNFGPASLMVGGADADLVIDNCLIDIKTTCKAERSLDELRQLVGYVLLQQLSGTHLNRDGTLEPWPSHLTSVGLYYARYGLMQRFALDDLLDPLVWPETRIWFAERFQIPPSLSLPAVPDAEPEWPAPRSRVAMEAWLESMLQG